VRNVSGVGPYLDHNVSLSVSPSSGNQPLTSTLTADVSGTAIGTISYTFYCDRNDNGTNIILPASAKFDGESATSKSFTCTYSSPGSFSPKVIVERDSGVPSATDKKTVTVVNVVRNNPPIVTSPSLTPPLGDGFCASPPVYTFRWGFDSNGDGDTHAASNFEICNTTRPSCSNTSFSGLIVAVSFTLGSSENLGSQQLTYSTDYKWRVRVKDSNNAWSNWSDYQTFKTPLHQYPAASFSVNPNSPPENTSVVFDAGASQCFGSSRNRQYSWIFPDAAPASATGQKPTTKFIGQGNKTVKLNVTDENNRSCSLEKEVNVRWGLPDWKEIIPQ